MAEIDGITPDTKACKVCGEAKILARFPKVAKARDGRGWTCHSCLVARRKERQSDEVKAAQRQRIRDWKARNRDAVVAQHARTRARKGMKSRSELAASSEQRRIDRAASAALSAIKREADKVRRRSEKPWLVDGLTSAERWSIRYRLDPSFNLRERMRTALRHKRDGKKLSELLRGAIRRGGSSPTAEQVLGYDVAQLRVHIERQFTKGMDWSEFLDGRIHLDHIVPLSSFDLTDPSELKAAWALSNLRPLEAGANIAKGADRLHLL